MAGDEKSLVVVNRRQASFYDAFDGETHLNLPSRLWRRFRRRVKSVASVHERAESFQAEAFAAIQPRRVLEVGCYDGRAATLALIRQPWLERYVGIDLSPKAIDRFRSKLSTRDAEKVELRAEDFLTINLKQESFDAVYMNGVLHHFPDPEHIVTRITKILVPGGAFVTFDPMITNPLFRAVRAAYRPFQSDREWEWPLTHEAFRALAAHLELCRIQGFLGMEMYGALLYAFLPLRWTEAVAHWGRRIDREQANRIGRALFRCNMVAMWWRKPV